MWIDLRFVKLPDFCYVCGMLGHVTKGCGLYNPSVAESDFQYGDWLRASPMKSRRRGAEAEIREERKLYLAFRSEQQVAKARLKLNFDTTSQQAVAQGAKGLGSPNQSMGVEAMDIAVPGTEVSKRRLLSSDTGRGTEKVRVVMAAGPSGDGAPLKAEVAEQPRLHQWVFSVTTVEGWVKPRQLLTFGL